MAVFGFVKFQACLNKVNISFEPEFGNPRFETLKRLNVFQFSVHLFLSNCWFYHLVLYKPQQRNGGVLSLFLGHFFFMLCSKREFSNPTFQTKLFETHVLTQPDFENLKKIHFKPEKGHFCFTLKEPVHGWAVN